MADTGLSGHWKGLAVSRDRQAVIHIYFEHNDNVLNGRFEASDLVGPDSKGGITGSMDTGKRIQLTSRSLEASFSGELHGEGTRHEIIFGVLSTPSVPTPIGTLTLFRQQPHEYFPTMY